MSAAGALPLSNFNFNLVYYATHSNFNIGVIQPHMFKNDTVSKDEEVIMQVHASEWQVSLLSSTLKCCAV